MVSRTVKKIVRTRQKVEIRREQKRAGRKKANGRKGCQEEKSPNWKRGREEQKKKSSLLLGVSSLYLTMEQINLWFKDVTLGIFFTDRPIIQSSDLFFCFK